MRVGTFLLLIALTTRGELAAQTSREALRQGFGAVENFDDARAIEFFSIGLNPAGGPRDSLWTAGLHALANALIDRGMGNLANIWLRWAMRQQPDLPVDDVNYTPAVTQPFENARSFVASTAPERAIVGWAWDWTSVPDPTAPGAIQIRQTGGPVRVQIEETEAFFEGTRSPPLPAGSYTLSISSDVYNPARITVEVLPGITSVLDLQLEPAFAAYLYVAAKPWATVEVDGRTIGDTPIAAYRLAEGGHFVRLFRPGYVTFDTTVTVGRDQRVRLGTISLIERRER